jgi:hypothetical protein
MHNYITYVFATFMEGSLRRDAFSFTSKKGKYKKSEKKVSILRGRIQANPFGLILNKLVIDSNLNRGMVKNGVSGNH